MTLNRFPQKIIVTIKELGKITPIAFVTTFLPMLGAAILLTFASPISEWLRGNWEIGSVIFVLGILIFCGLALLPTNVIGIISGWAFGFTFGILLLMLGIVGAATISFLIHKRMVGDKLTETFEHHPKANAIYKALLAQGFWRTTLLIFLLRLSPAMPFALTNFLMTSARVSLLSFVIGTFFGMLPRSSAVVLVGSGLSVLSFNDPQEFWLIIFGIMATIISIIFIGIVSKRALEKLTEQADTI